MQVNASIVSAALATCIAPTWSTASWTDYNDERDGIANLTLLSAIRPSNSSASAQWSSIINPQQYRFRKVNHAPGFMGANVQVEHFSRRADGSYAAANWTRVIYKGVLSDHSVAWDEDVQEVSFEVRAIVPSYFKVLPQITADGNLTFTPAENKAGRTTIEVIAKDNGGTEYGGQDRSSPRRFSITLTGTGVSRDFLNFDRIVTQRNLVSGQGFVRVYYFAEPERVTLEGSSALTLLVSSITFDTPN